MYKKINNYLILIIIYLIPIYIKINQKSIKINKIIIDSNYIKNILNFSKI